MSGEKASSTTHPSMHAYALAAEGQEAGFYDVPRPVPVPGEVLVAITTASINPHDASVRSGAAARYMTYVFPVILGSDFAGVVEQVGDGVTDLQPGDRVFGVVRERLASRGSLAPYVSVPRDWVACTPSSVSDLAAGALGLAAVAAVRCADAIEPEAPGDVVLVNGATGGIGGYLLQLLAARDVHTIATARHGEEAAYVAGLGASETVDWRIDDLEEVVSERHPTGIDAIIDLVTPDRESLTRLATALVKSGGHVVSTRHAAAPEELTGLDARNLMIELDPDILDRIAEYADSGVLQAPQVETYAFEQIPAAFDALAGGVRGKISVQVSSS